MWCVEHFRDYLLTAPHIVVNTDHLNLKWLWNLTANRRITRWALQLQEYNMTINYRKANEQIHVDMLTRNTVQSIKDVSGQMWTDVDSKRTTWILNFWCAYAKIVYHSWYVSRFGLCNKFIFSDSVVYCLQ